MSCCQFAAKFVQIDAGPSQDVQKERFEKRWNLNLRDTATFADFQIKRTVGVGAFGRVLYVMHKKSKHDYALKMMLKEKIVRTNQVERVLFEKRIMIATAHPNLVDLRFVFKTNSYLCIVMPFIRGGEIYSYLRSKKTFSEYQTRFYSAQIILALQYMHSMNIVYRDLKPENILLDCDGYLKITDFGFAKRIVNNKTHSFVGTPEYMAPEMLIKESRKEGYGFSVDWWALGVFIYESAAGRPPFSGPSLLQIFDKIVKCQFSIPDHFSLGLTDLIDKIFQLEVKKRIGCSDKGVEEVKEHPWFQLLNWQALFEKKLPPEFVPNCNLRDPTGNFDKYEEIPLEDASEQQYVEEFKAF